MSEEDWLGVLRAGCDEGLLGEGTRFNRQMPLLMWCQSHIDEFFDHYVMRSEFERLYGADIPKSEWDLIFNDVERQTVGDVSRLLSRCGGRLIVVDPIHMAGRPCLAGGMFLALRALLRREGLDVSELTPSTMLDTFGRRDLFRLWDSVWRIDPGYRPDPVWWALPAAWQWVMRFGFFGLTLLSRGVAVAALILQCGRVAIRRLKPFRRAHDASARPRAVTLRDVCERLAARCAMHVDIT
jgi:hypothetical protein